MSTYIYLSVIPEALIGSMLAPVEFGQYLSTGTKKRNKGQAIFFEIDPEKAKDSIDMNYLDCRCISKTDGTPKSSVYLAVYRVLESIPLEAFKSLYITTENGVVHELKPAVYDVSKDKKGELHLYQELCPVTPQIASSLAPHEFLKKMTDGTLHIKLPKLIFVDLRLGSLAQNILDSSNDYLPTRHVGHLRDCLEILSNEYEKQMKTVQRSYSGSLLYRTIQQGFFAGDKDKMLYYPFPDMKILENSNYEFFRAI